MNSMKLMGLSLGLIVLANVAQASKIKIHCDGMKAGALITVKEPTFEVMARAGAFALEDKSGTTAWTNGKTLGFCAEFTTPTNPWIDQKYTIENLASKVGTEKAQDLSELWGRYYNPNWTTTGNKYYDNRAVVFQVCVWEILNDGANGSITNGKFSMDTSGFGTNTDMANRWLASLDGTGPKANLELLTNSDCRDFVVLSTTNPAVPEPITLVMVMSAIPYVWLKKRRMAA